MDSYLLFQSQTHKPQCFPLLVFQLQNSLSEIKAPLSYLLPLWCSAALNHPELEYPTPLFQQSVMARRDVHHCLLSHKARLLETLPRELSRSHIQEKRGSSLLFFSSIPPSSFPFCCLPLSLPPPAAHQQTQPLFRIQKLQNPQQPIAHQKEQILANHRPRSFLRVKGWLRELWGVGMGKCRAVYEEKRGQRRRE